MLWKTLLAVALLMGVATPGLAGGGHGGGALCPGFGEGTTISMLDSCFDATAHFVPAGAVLTVTNDGVVPHTYTAVGGSFDSGLLEGGGRWEVDSLETGIYRVYCTLHGSAAGDGMAGVLVVGEPSTALTGVAAGAVPRPESPSGTTVSGWEWVPLTAGAATAVALAALVIATWAWRRNSPALKSRPSA